MGKLFRDYRKQPRWLPLIFRFIALIGCRSIELCPEEFWSLPDGDALWKARFQTNCSYKNG